VVKAAAYADAGIIDKYVWANLKCLYTIEERAAAGVVDKIRGNATEYLPAFRLQLRAQRIQ
jgi:hypothetical protein